MVPHLHVEQIELSHTNISVHVEQLVELAHLEEEDNVEIVGLELPPLSLGRSLSIQEALGHVQRARVVVGMIRSVAIFVLRGGEF